MTLSRVVLVALFAAGCAGSSPQGLPPAPVEDDVPELRVLTRKDVSGAVVREWKVLIYADGRQERHGMDQAWYSNGEPRYERPFRNGEPYGRWVTWYDDGTLRSEYEFADGPTEMVFYHEDGTPSARGLATRGLRTGLWTFSYPNGNVAKRGRYEDGHPTGEWIHWYSNGGLKSRGEMRGSTRVGQWHHWDEEPPTFFEDGGFGSVEDVPRDFAATVRCVVDMSVYPTAETLIVAGPDESLVDPTDAVGAVTVQLESMALDRLRAVDVHGRCEPIDVPVGDYYVELWSTDAAGNPVRLYSELQSIRGGSQTVNID